MDPNINYLLRSNEQLKATLRRLEIKFDRIADNVGFENMFDVMEEKLNSIQKRIHCPSKNAIEATGMAEKDLLDGLVAAVHLSNESIRKLATNFDLVNEAC